MNLGLHGLTFTNGIVNLNAKSASCIIVIGSLQLESLALLMLIQSKSLLSKIKTLSEFEETSYSFKKMKPSTRNASLENKTFTMDCIPIEIHSSLEIRSTLPLVSLELFLVPLVPNLKN